MQRLKQVAGTRAIFTGAAVCVAVAGGCRASPRQPAFSPTSPAPQATQPVPAAAATSVPANGVPLNYTCPMHPEIQSTWPAACPRCGMALVQNAGANVAPAVAPRPPQQTAAVPASRSTAYSARSNDGASGSRGGGCGSGCCN